MSTPSFWRIVKSAACARPLAIALVAALVVCLFGMTPAKGQNINWVGGTSTDWNTAANWDLDAVPTSSNNITLDTNSGNQPVMSTGSASGNIIVVGNTTASGANTLLTIQGGAQVVWNSLLIGNATGSTGSVLVTDTGTVLNTPESVTSPPPATAQIGVNGTGSLTIANGAQVNGMSLLANASGSNATVLVTGDGSTWTPGRTLFDGRSGIGNISITNGGSIQGAELTMSPNSQFIVTGQAASGNHSTYNSLFRPLITSQNNILTVSNGGHFIDGDGITLSGQGTSMLVTDPGSELVLSVIGKLVGTTGFYVGLSSGSNSSLTIANGANLTSNTYNYIGYSANSTGGVTITGPGSVWNATGNIVVGNATNSTGSLTLANGGSINITSGNIILGQNGGKGILNLNDGAFFQDGNANGTLVIGNNSTINWNGGAMQATKNISLGANMTMTGNGCVFDSNGYFCSFFGNISGSGNIVKNGNGNLSITNLSPSNVITNSSFQSYNGNIAINAGVLIFEHFYPIGNISTNITDNATLFFGQNFEFTGNYTGILSGNGLVNINGNITMAGSSNFTGNIQMSQGSALTLEGDMSQMGGNIAFNGSAFGGTQLNFAQNFDTTYAGNLSGSAYLTKIGAGNLVLSGNLDIPGRFNIQLNSGNIIFTGNISQDQAGLSLGNGTNVILCQSTDCTWSAAIGSGNLIQSGSGVLTISSPQLQGNIIINSGIVLLNDGAFSQTGNIVNNSNLVFSAPFDDACPVVISGTGVVTINATGNLTLTANSTYTGATTINSGTLLVDGQLAAASNVAVNGGAALGGNGTLLGSVTVNAGGGLVPGDNGNTLINDNGTLSPGNGGNLTYLGTLSVNSLSLDPAASINFDLTDPGNYSNLSVANPLAEAGNVVITLEDGFQPGTYQLIGGTGGLSNDFSNITITGLYSTALADSGGMWTSSIRGVNFSFNAATGQLVTNYTIVPLDPSGTTTFSVTNPGSITPLAVNGTLAEAGNLVLNLGGNLHAGTYQLITSNGGTSNDFANVTLTGLYSGTLTDNGGVWSGNASGANFTFNAATGQLVVSTPLPSGISDSKTAWLEQYFSVPQLLDSSISGDNASPAGDGISNLVKYALNLNPLVDGHAGLPQISTDGTYLYFYSVPYQSDINYTIEASTDLANWSSDGVDVYPYDPNLLVGSYPVPASGTAFMRLVVSSVASPSLTSSSGSSESLTNPDPASARLYLQNSSAGWSDTIPIGFTQPPAGFGAATPVSTDGSSVPTTSGGRRGGPPPPSTRGQP